MIKERVLELRKITKVYKTGDFEQKALNSVSLNFRESEFASILGPSGSGKTTLLNIIGGLDSYTKGDLVIDGISTKNFKDADWDAYRNHRIGFVFQSYNLIPHQTILSNVRLALTLSGISKKEGNRRAKKALEEVGLGEHLHKRPAELSGGQMQRVAIARALVNDPDIVLADEPTGALDSETSVQIMDILKTIANSKLVIMVTHNPDLAKEYSTRIINLKDGVITSDSKPFDPKKSAKPETPEKPARAKAIKAAKTNPKVIDVVKNTTQAPTKETNTIIRARKSKKTKMNKRTAFGLSLSNLLTKKARTVLISIAGSIGIIGIALILAVSTGFQNYVDGIQEDTLDSYPLAIMEQSFSMEGLFVNSEDIASEGSMKTLEQSGKDVIEYPVLGNTLKSVATNDLKSFKNYYEAHAAELEHDLKNVSYSYSVDPIIYTVDAKNKVAKLNPSNLFDSMFGSNSMMSSFSSFTSIYSQIGTDDETIKSQYDILAGRLPESYNELIIVLSGKHAMSDLLAYELGLKDTAELGTLVAKLMSGESVNIKTTPLTLGYDELMALDLRLVHPSDLYRYSDRYNVYEDMSADEDFVKAVYENKSEKLKIVGILTSKPETTGTGSLNPGVNYRADLIDHIISHAARTDIVKKQLEDKDVDVFSGARFDQDSDKFNYTFSDLVSVDEEKLASAFGSNRDAFDLTSLQNQVINIAATVDVDTSPARTDFADTLEFLLDGAFESIEETYQKSTAKNLVEGYLNTFAAGEKLSALEKKYLLPSDSFKPVYSGIITSALESYADAYYLLDPSLTPEPAEGEELDPVAKKDENSLKLVKALTLYSPQVLLVENSFADMMTELKLKTEVMQNVMHLVESLTTSFAQSINIDANAITSAFTLNFTEDELMRVVSSMMNNTEKTQKSNLISLGYQSKDDPTYISFYFQSFEGKENFLNFLKNYNESVDENKKINYTDATGILMDSVKVIVDAVSYVLIAFVSISLIVSSFMIGIITYISVYERKKEIGILRAMGASKKNVSSIFNAETAIIGFLAGLFGIGFSYLFIPIINAILNFFTGNVKIAAALNPSAALILVILSIALTLMGGLIPAKSAAKRDPVEALRSE